MNWAIVTDLDGTLLDAVTYDWEPAGLVLAALRRRGIPVVPCTSKTRAETDALMHEIGLTGPRIVENGAAVVLGGETLVLGTPYARIRESFATLKRRCGTRVRGFGDMTSAEIAHRTGLEPAAAERAQAREYDEPFVIEPADPALVACVVAAATDLGMRATFGGRFWHLHGATDKGRAFGRLRERMPPACWLGLGDAPGDLALLLAVDEPIAVPRPDGNIAPELAHSIPHLRLAPQPGPRGWADAVMAVIRND